MDEEESYIPTNASQLLLKDHPFSITLLIMSVLNPITIEHLICSKMMTRRHFTRHMG